MPFMVKSVWPMKTHSTGFFLIKTVINVHKKVTLHGDVSSSNLAKSLLNI